MKITKLSIEYVHSNCIYLGYNIRLENCEISTLHLLVSLVTFVIQLLCSYVIKCCSVFIELRAANINILSR